MNLLASLRYLVALAEHRHFARAAEACHITQPALSNALRALEQEFGTPIVRRGRTYAGLTEEGGKVLATARRMLREHELLQQDLAGTEAHPRGRLRIGAVPTAVPVAARFAALLRERHPGIAPVVRSMSSLDIESGLQDLALDLGLGFSERIEAERGRFRLLPQYTEHYYLLRRSGAAGPLRLAGSLAWREAAGLPLCLLTPEMHNRRIVDAAFSAAGASVQPAMETDSLMALVLAVTAGGIASILPGALVGAVRSEPGLEALTLVEPTLSTPVAFFLPERTDPSRTLAAAVALVADAAWLEVVGRHTGALVAFNP